MNARFYVLVLLLAAQAALAKKAPVVLMPADRQGASATAPATQVQYRDRNTYDRSATSIGIEGGMVGRKQSTDSDILGVQALLGGRAFAWLPVYQAFSLKPSVGYFYKRESVGAVSVTQTHLEGGLGLLWTAYDTNDFKWNLGLSNRVTRATSVSTVFTSSTNGSSDMFARSGPATGVLVRVGGKLQLVADFEMTWTFERPTRSYMGLSSGLAFEL